MRMFICVMSTIPVDVPFTTQLLRSLYKKDMTTETLNIITHSTTTRKLQGSNLIIKHIKRRFLSRNIGLRVQMKLKTNPDRDEAINSTSSGSSFYNGGKYSQHNIFKRTI